MGQKWVMVHPGDLRVQGLCRRRRRLPGGRGLVVAYTGDTEKLRVHRAQPANSSMRGFRGGRRIQACAGAPRA